MSTEEREGQVTAPLYFRGGFRFTDEKLKEALGMRGHIYAVVREITGTVVFYCHEAQCESVIREGEYPVIVDPSYD